jgi:hypothetical protein
MDTNSTVATNAVTNLTSKVHDQPFHYGWAVVGILGSILIAWLLRKIFWQKDSN